MSALDALDERQREAASVLRGPVAVLAGAGTGKTRVITHRIAHGVDTGAYTPNRVMAVTFTAKAAGELRGRLRALGIEGVAARTFHAAALAQLNFFWPTLAGSPAPQIVDNKVRLLGQAAEQLRLRPDTATLRDIASEIEWRKVSMRSIEQHAALGRSVGRVSTEQMVDLQRAYEVLKDDRRQLDFEDVLLACAGMLEAEPRVAASRPRAVPPLHRRRVPGRLAAAEPAARALAGRAARHLRGRRCQPDDLLVRRSRSALPAGVRPHLPRRHDRAARDELPFAAADPRRRERPDERAAGSLELIAVRGAPTADIPTVTAYDSETDEAAGIAASIAARVAAGSAPSEIAVLYRAHAQSAAIQQALADAGIAATVLGGKRFFDMPEVRQIVLALRGASVAPTERGFLPNVRRVLRELGLTDRAAGRGRGAA